MTIELATLRYVGLFEEPAGSYGVDHSGTPGDFLAVPYKEGTLQAAGARAQLDPMTGKMRLDGHDKKILGVRSCTVNVGLTLHTHGVVMDGDESAQPSASTWALLRALRAIMGGVSTTGTESAGTVVVAGSTTTTAVEVTSGHGDRWVPGSVIACTVNGVLELREVKSVAGDVVSVKEAFSAAPTTGSAVRGGVTVYLTEDPDTSLQVLVEGREATDGACFRGLQGGFTLELPIGELGTISLALSGAGWARLGSSAVTIPSYSQYSPLLCAPLDLHAPKIGDTTMVQLCPSAVTVEPQIAYAPVRCGRAAETIARMRRQPARPVVRGSFTVPYEDDTWYTARDDREDRAIFVQAGYGMLVSIPTVQIVDVQPGPSAEGIAGQVVTFEGRHDEEIGSTSALSYSALRLHFV